MSTVHTFVRNVIDGLGDTGRRVVRRALFGQVMRLLNRFERVARAEEVLRRQERAMEAGTLRTDAEGKVLGEEALKRAEERLEDAVLGLAAVIEAANIPEAIVREEFNAAVAFWRTAGSDRAPKDGFDEVFNQLPEFIREAVDERIAELDRAQTERRKAFDVEPLLARVLRAAEVGVRLDETEPANRSVGLEDSPWGLAPEQEQPQASRVTFEVASSIANATSRVLVNQAAFLKRNAWARLTGSSDVTLLQKTLEEAAALAVAHQPEQQAGW